MRKILMLGLLVFVVFLAGCATRETSTGGTGVIIKSFAPDLLAVDGDSPVTFIVNVKNTGDRKAENVNAQLYGLSNEWKGTMGVKSISTTLFPADPSVGMKGEEGSTDWTITAPAGKGSDVTYDAEVRVLYSYSTLSDTFLRFVTSDYVRTNPAAEKGVTSSKSTAGPLVITAAARTPIISAGSTIGRVQFEIQNIGGGKVFKGAPSTATIESGKLDYITTITITGVGAGPKGNCAGNVADSSGKVTLPDVRLAVGKSKIISCDVDVSGIVNFKDIALNLTASYNYFVDSATQVTVSKALQ